jgi:hypothetical protein
MAELSPETQAIIQTLKDEGQLIRNRGTNSIRSVKIEMAKFHDVFNTISANVIEQTGILRQQAGFAAEALEAQRTREQLEELQEKQKYEDTDSESKRKTDENIERIGNKLESAFSLKNLALAGAGLFVGYNLLKGFIDDQTGGGFSNLEAAIGETDWGALGSSVNQFVTGIGEIDWASLSAAVNIASGAINNFGDWMNNILPGILVGGILGSIARGAIRGGVEGLINGGRGRVDPSDARLINQTQRNAIRAGIAGIVATGVLVFGDQVKNWVNQQEWSDNEIAGARVGDVIDGTINVASAAAMGATIGSFFGPGGTLAFAILGGSVALGVQLYNWYQGKRRERAAQLAADIAAADRLLETRQEEFEQLATNLAGMTPQQQAAQTTELTGPELQALNRVIEENPILQLQEELNYQLSEIQRFRDMGNVGTADQMQSSLRSSDPDSLYAQALEESVRLEQLLQSMEIDGVMRAGVNSQQYQSILSMFQMANQIVNSILDPSGSGVQFGPGNSFRSGTQGFMDFGAGQFAILHGKEAVVPFNTAAGRFLDQYFTENWEPKAVNNQRLQTAATGGTGSPVVVINAPTTVSPTVNNVSGGKSVNQVSVRTGGGNGFGGGTSNPYGLPYAVN